MFTTLLSLLVHSVGLYGSFFWATALFKAPLSVYCRRVPHPDLSPPPHSREVPWLPLTLHLSSSALQPQPPPQPGEANNSHRGADQRREGHVAIKWRASNKWHTLSTFICSGGNKERCYWFRISFEVPKFSIIPSPLWIWCVYSRLFYVCSTGSSRKTTSSVAHQVHQ